MKPHPKTKHKPDGPVQWEGFAIPKKSVKLTGASYAKFKAGVIKRDKYRCKRCGKRFKANELTIHHKIKRSHLRLDTPDNAETLCLRCHVFEEIGR